MPNVENINKTIDLMRKITPESGTQFNMSEWLGYRHDYDTDEICGTAGCLAGWAVMVQGGITEPNLTEGQLLAVCEGGFMTRGAAFLGIDGVTAYQLFEPNPTVQLDNGGYFYPYSATAEQAIKVLEHLRDTGEVDWSVAVK